MGNQGQLVSLYIAPRASVTIAQLEKIDRSIELCAPHRPLDSLYGLINLHERSRSQQRIQHEVGKTDVTIETVPKVQMLNERGRYFSPDIPARCTHVIPLAEEGTSSNG